MVTCRIPCKYHWNWVSVHGLMAFRGHFAQSHVHKTMRGLKNRWNAEAENVAFVRGLEHPCYQKHRRSNLLCSAANSFCCQVARVRALKLRLMSRPFQSLNSHTSPLVGIFVTIFLMVEETRKLSLNLQEEANVLDLKKISAKDWLPRYLKLLYPRAGVVRAPSWSLMLRQLDIRSLPHTNCSKNNLVFGCQLLLLPSR